MKKRTAILVTGLCALTLLAGCGQNTADQAGDNSGAEVGSYTASEYVTLGDYMNMEISVTKEDVTEEDVKEYIESMLTNYPTYTTLDKTQVEDGDTVDIDYEGLLDGVAFDGGTSQGYTLTIGSNSFIQGFEEGLVGANVGDTLALNLTFPDPYKNNPDLAGRPVVFNVTVNAIVEAQNMTYDALTDEYVADLGYKTVQEYKDAVLENLTNTNEYYAQVDARTAVIKKLQEICTVNSLPEGLLDHRVKEYKEQFATMCQEQYNMELADYLDQYYQTTEEEFTSQVVENMQADIELELILAAVAEAEGITLDEEGYADYLANMTANYGYETEDEFLTQYGEDYIKSTYVCNKAIDVLLENAKITYTAPEAADTTDDAADTTDDAADTTDDAADTAGE